MSEIDWHLRQRHKTEREELFGKWVHMQDRAGFRNTLTGEEISYEQAYWRGLTNGRDISDAQE